MKRKGITIWELYVERMVLGFAALIFVGVSAFNLLSRPNVVNDVAPSEVDDLLRREAESVRGQLEPGAAPTIEVPRYEPLAPRFAEAIGSSISPALALDLPGPRIGLGAETTSEVGADLRFHEPAFGAPDRLLARQSFGALDPETVSAVEELQQRFPEEPHDITWVSVYAVAPIAAWREALADPGDVGESPIPPNWYDNRVDMLDLVLEREQLVDGTWTDRTVVGPLPGMTYSFRERLAADPNKRDRDDMIAELLEPGRQEVVIRPPFYDTIDDAWAAVDPRLEESITVEEEMAESDAERELRHQERRYRQALAEKAEVERTLDEEGAPYEAERPGRPPRGDRDRSGRSGGEGEGGGRREAPPGGVAPPGAGGGIGAGGEPKGGVDPAKEREKRILGLQRRWKRAAGDVERIARKIDELRIALGLPPLGEEPVEVVAAPTDLLSGDEVVVWSHDIDVEPGATYRYRVRIEVVNPFFARTLDLTAAQEDLARRATIASDSSPWSSPVEVQPPTRLFITKATVEGRQREGRATAEVYHYERGRWWYAAFPVEPGMRVGEPRSPRGAGPVDIDFGTSWFVLDIREDIDADERARDAGLAGEVVLQHFADAERIRVVRPMADRSDDERLRLRDLVDQAESVEVAAGT